MSASSASTCSCNAGYYGTGSGSGLTCSSTCSRLFSVACATTELPVCGTPDWKLLEGAQKNCPLSVASVWCQHLHCVLGSHCVRGLPVGQHKRLWRYLVHLLNRLLDIWQRSVAGVHWYVQWRNQHAPNRSVQWAAHPARATGRASCKQTGCSAGTYSPYGATCLGN